MIDVRWPILDAGRVPLRHQYPLLSAIANLVPSTNEHDSIGIHPIRGVRVEPAFLQLTKARALTVRPPVEQMSMLLILSGWKLDIGGTRFA